MSILKYFKRYEDVPDPRGSLFSSISSAATAAVNSKVRKVTDGGGSGKHGKYNRSDLAATNTVEVSV